MERLGTDRLVLRPFEADDLDALAVLHAEPSFWWFSLGRGQTREETGRFLDQQLDHYRSDGFGFAAVVERAGGELAGWAGLGVPRFLPEVLPAVEVGWRLGAKWRGKGFATEAGSAWVRWGFEALGLDRIISIYQPANVASGRVMTKLGFTLERVTEIGQGLELHVTALDNTWWRELCEAGTWPLPVRPGQYSG